MDAEKAVLVRAGRRVRYRNLRPGLFLFGDTLCLRTEYGSDSYIVSTGEAFWGGVLSPAARAELMVWPVRVQRYG